MMVMESLTIETEMPMKQVTDFRFLWHLDEHAAFWLNGILDGKAKETGFLKNYKGTDLVIKLYDEVLFHGVIVETEVHVTGGVYRVEIQAASASVRLDSKTHGEMFQDVSLTYRQMIKKLASEAGGQVICTVGEQSIQKPLLCYEESIWKYAGRMASHFQAHVIADVKTGTPSFWFGMRKGNDIKEHGLDCEEIELEKPVRHGRKVKLSYRMKGWGNYCLGDRLYIEDGWHIIYEKRACLERGEVVCTYLTADEKTLDVETVYQEKFTGLSLKGTVEKTEGEQIYISLDLDGKQGTYPFPWYPETGNGWYAMPEAGAKVELYFMGADEREAAAIRCRDTKKTESDEKKIELLDGAKLLMDASGVKLKKNDQLDMLDRGITFSGDKDVELSAEGKVKLSAKIVEISAPEEIKYVTEM